MQRCDKGHFLSKDGFCKTCHLKLEYKIEEECNKAGPKVDLVLERGKEGHYDDVRLGDYPIIEAEEVKPDFKTEFIYKDVSADDLRKILGRLKMDFVGAKYYCYLRRTQA